MIIEFCDITNIDFGVEAQKTLRHSHLDHLTSQRGKGEGNGGACGGEINLVGMLQYRQSGPE